jgi:hypothetical protein
MPVLGGVVEVPVWVSTAAPPAAPPSEVVPAVPMPADVVEFAPVEPGALGEGMVWLPVADPVPIPPAPTLVPADCPGTVVVAPAVPPVAPVAPAPAPAVCASTGVASAMAATNNAFFICSLLAAYRLCGWEKNAQDGCECHYIRSAERKLTDMNDFRSRLTNELMLAGAR